MVRAATAIIALIAASATAAPVAAPGVRARSVISQGQAHIAHGQLEAALRDADRADGQGASAPPELRCAAEAIRGAVAEARSELDAEMAHYLQSLEWADRSRNQALIGLAVESAFYAYFRQSKSALALALVNERLDRTPGGNPNRPKFLALRARVLMDMRDWPSAAGALDQALPLAQASGDASDLASIHEFRGMLVLRSRHDHAAALAEFEQALAFARRGSSLSSVAMILVRTGTVYRDQAAGGRDNLVQALHRYEAALAVARRAGVPSVTATALKNIGDVYRMLGDVDRAERALAEAIEVADRGGITQIRWMARLYAALLAAPRDPDGAERLFAGSLDVLEHEANGLALDELRAGSLAAEVTIGDNPYDRFIEFLLARQRPDRAFFVAERERSRVLLDSLSAARDTLPGAAPPGFSAAERGTLARIKRAQTTLRTEAIADERRRELLSGIDRDEAQLQALRLRLAVDRPSLAQARYPTLQEAVNVRTRLLEPDEALVSLYLGADRSSAWVLTRDRMSVLALPSRARIEPLVHAALEELRNPRGRTDTALTALSRALAVDDLAREAGGSRLIVIPHGILYDVPFEALVDRAGRPLLERFVVSYAPSASSLAFLRSARRRAPAQATLVALANPVVGGAPAPGTRQADLAHLNLLTPLPYSSDEAKQIAAGFGREARVLVGPQATVAALRASGVEHARILHFATHGLIDETRPDRSGLVLTADPPHDDGLLQTRDIYAMRLDSDLVTLSACETALGQNVTGEGMIGLTRAFFFAGARSVVASLWDVEDASTSRLMQQFYANIRRGEPIDAALQHAKIALLHAGGETSRPFYWASFIVSGQARTVVDLPPAGALATAAASARTWIAAALGALTGVGWLYARRRAAVSPAGS